MRKFIRNAVIPAILAPILIAVIPQKIIEGIKAQREVARTNNYSITTNDFYTNSLPRYLP